MDSSRFDAFCVARWLVIDGATSLMAQIPQQKPVDFTPKDQVLPIQMCWWCEAKTLKECHISWNMLVIYGNS